MLLARKDETDKQTEKASDTIVASDDMKREFVQMQIANIKMSNAQKKEKHDGEEEREIKREKHKNRREREMTKVGKRGESPLIT